MIKMKPLLLFLVLILSMESFARKITISGRVEDESAQPVSFVNVYVGTYGAMTDDDGLFCFSISTEEKSFILKASVIGYDTYSREFTAQSDQSIVITLKTMATELEGIIVKGNAQQVKGNGAWSNISPIDIVTVGGSAGDLYRSLQAMPGVQTQGESGKLVVHGGDSRETQTYIDDMHVMAPYSTAETNVGSRGRYSPFMFEGINFSSGGYSQEYGDGLSAMLPLYTKDESKLTKWGINPSTVGLAAGGTKAFDKGSVSLNLEYRNLGPYYSVVSNRLDVVEPYQNASVATQMRFTPNQKTVLKSYVSYDRTQFAEGIMDLVEDNIYTNTTFRYTSDNDYHLFAGVAFSSMTQCIDGAVHTADTFEDHARELHLKAKVSKRFANVMNLSIGVESFIRQFSYAYNDSTVNLLLKANPNLFSAFAIATFYPVHNMNVDVSTRLEGNIVSPRISANYNISDVNLSLTAGRYLQQPELKYLYMDENLKSEKCLHYVAGVKYISNGRIYRAEAYYKDYKNLSLISDAVVTSEGYGYSKGFDFYLSDESLFKGFEYQLSYSYNSSKRESGYDIEMKAPYYVSRHSTSLVLKYGLKPLKSIIGTTYQYASGRPYSGGLTKPYNSMDMSVTFLASPKVIVYGSISNVLGIKNQFSNAGGAIVRPASDRFIYLGIFISLGGKAAYDVSNF